MIEYAVLTIPTGSLVLSATNRSVQRVTIIQQRGTAAQRCAASLHANGRENRCLLPKLQKQLHNYFEGQRVEFDVPVDVSHLTDFQQRVLEACARIPFGQTATYGRLARQIGRPRAARAVGATMAKNPIPIIIPCHRVVAADGTLCGFSAEQGLAIKRWLLELEAHQTVPAWPIR